VITTVIYWGRGLWQNYLLRFARFTKVVFRPREGGVQTPRRPWPAMRLHGSMSYYTTDLWKWLICRICWQVPSWMLKFCKHTWPQANWYIFVSVASDWSANFPSDFSIFCLILSKYSIQKQNWLTEMQSAVYQWTTTQVQEKHFTF